MTSALFALPSLSMRSSGELERRSPIEAQVAFPVGVRRPPSRAGLYVRCEYTLSDD